MRPVYVATCNTSAILGNNGVLPDSIYPFTQSAQVYINFQNTSACLGYLALSSSEVKIHPKLQQ